MKQLSLVGLRPLIFGLAVALVTTISSCYSEGLGASSSGRARTTVHPRAVPDASYSVSTDSGSTPEVDAGFRGELCAPVVGADALPARTPVMSAQAAAKEVPFFTRDLFGLFKSSCGACHSDFDEGGFGKVTLQNFGTKVDQKVIDRILSDDPKQYMPPATAGGTPGSRRSGGDPVRRLAALVGVWLKAGKPGDLFYLPTATTSGDGGTSANGYVLSKAVGTALTNIGSCIPAKSIVAIDADRSVRLDDYFGAALKLPEKLSDTDLVSFDSEVLARQGVVSFAPAYPLWSDDSKKIRYVRVPKGRPIRFDAQSQRFDIPTNTRFYKTFLKKVIDPQGRPSFRKMETRVIVARPDNVNPDGSATPTSLFGTYVWNEDETEATLLQDALHDGKPFADRLQTYLTDEQKAAAILATKPRSKIGALQTAGVYRTYAFPGKQRCLDCHMGSESRTFVLGFTPLQINRRPKGQSGVIEPAGKDELGQLQRLVDYGVITGITSPDVIKHLEDSQGDRKPRNQHELDAQGYMLGNCGHCHNPRGLPSVQNPELAGILDFWPRVGGGIFQFPLERTSPRIKRGPSQDIPIPYITPSLRELPVSGQSLGEVWQSKRYVVSIDPYWFGGATHYAPVAAPWRSLVYRNVDTPFTYADHYAIFPHMPLDTAGYDCRTRKLLGDWMVSVPARRKDPGKDQDETDPVVPLADLNPQPYVEVTPGEAGYDVAVRDAEARLAEFHAGERYTVCPDTSDIIDPSVLPPTKLVPDPGTDATLKWTSGVPERAHWVVTDLTTPPGDWYPRRGDWATVLVDHKTDGLDDQQKVVVDVLQSLTITPSLRQFALTERPFGIWLQKDACDLSKAPLVSSFAADVRPSWFSDARPIPSPTDHVYMESPGAAVFNAICVNCHGPKADSAGRMAQTIMMITGGDTRVANLRDGILGPIDAPGTNRQRVFGKTATSTSFQVDDWAGRYVVWMGLGGTQRVIPQAVLSIVGNTPVLGRQRDVSKFDPATSANMLQTAQQLCTSVLGRSAGGIDFNAHTGTIDLTATPLISSNGDAEMWQALCRVDNPMPVRLVGSVKWTDAPSVSSLRIEARGSWYARSAYPSTAKVGDHRGKVVTGIQPDNQSPWCIPRPSDPAGQAVADQFVQDNAVDGVPLPFCPAELFADPANQLTEDALAKWSLRASMNAGLSVFLYLDSIARGTKPKPSYDACDQLSQ